MKDTKTYWQRGVLAVAGCRMIFKIESNPKKQKTFKPK